jgi:4-hydroxybenzoate polyprenyltransferase/phosphoserine phosphatase
MVNASFTESGNCPLCVDMDGTLLRTDTLHEKVLALLRQDVRHAGRMLFWLLKGRAHFKRKVSDHAQFIAESLPLTAAFVEYLRHEREGGRSLVLATAADERTARQVAARFAIFDEVIATDGETNLKGRQKLARLVQRFGERQFDYAGNSRADLPIWRAARQAILVNVTPRLAEEARQQARVTRIFEERTSLLATMAGVLRVHHWPKNLLLFVPAIAGHQLDRVAILGQLLLGFLAFCFCASGVYVVNDLHDLEADRQHHSKRSRPFASGQVAIGTGFWLAPLLLATAAACASFLPLMFQIYLGIYCGAALLYSWGLKRVVMLDVFVLAGLYTLRMLAGHGASGIGYSNWLLGFSLFVFLSLALLKRYIELRRLTSDGGAAGRGYVANDAHIVSALGMACGCVSALVLALYINSQEVHLLYARPWVLLFICPLLLYWVSRTWLLASRDLLNDDPVVFALKDWSSYCVGGIIALFVWMATG